jgi:hypothetical protein
LTLELALTPSRLLPLAWALVTDAAFQASATSEGGDESATLKEVVRRSHVNEAYRHFERARAARELRQAQQGPQMQAPPRLAQTSKANPPKLVMPPAFEAKVHAAASEAGEAKQLAIGASTPKPLPIGELPYAAKPTPFPPPPPPPPLMARSTAGSTAGSTAASSSTAGSTARWHLPSCPESLRLPLEWHQVRYYSDPKTGERKFDRLTSPIDLPHPDLEFEGYVVSEDGWQIDAFFKKKGLKNVRGCRLPRPNGGTWRRQPPIDPEL